MFNRLVKFFCVAFITYSLTACSDKAKLQPLDKNATILAFGDSLTYGTGTSLNKAYPAVLEKLIHRKVINAGIPGETSTDGLTRLPTLIKIHQPDLIIICHGGNDILRRFDLAKTRDNIQQMITLARQNNSQVILIGIPEFGLFLNTVSLYPELAGKNKIPIAADILSKIISKNTLKSDRVHLNAQGYQILAEEISTLLKNSGALPEL